MVKSCLAISNKAILIHSFTGEDIAGILCVVDALAASVCLISIILLLVSQNLHGIHTFITADNEIFASRCFTLCISIS